MCTVIIDTVIIILMLLIRVGCPCSRSEASSPKQWVNTDKESEIDDKDGHHPEDDDNHHLDGGDRPSLMLAHTAGAELVNLFLIETQHRLDHMLTVTICWAHCGVDVDLPARPVYDHIRVKCFYFWTLAATPVVHMVIGCGDGGEGQDQSE